MRENCLKPGQNEPIFIACFGIQWLLVRLGLHVNVSMKFDLFKHNDLYLANLN